MNTYISWLICLIINAYALIHFSADPFGHNEYTDKAIGTITQVEQTKQYSGGIEYTVYHSTIEFIDRYNEKQTILNNNKVIGAFLRDEKRVAAVDTEETKDYVGKTVSIVYNRDNPQHFKTGDFTSGDKLAYITPVIILMQTLSILFAIYDTQRKKKGC